MSRIVSVNKRSVKWKRYFSTKQLGNKSLEERKQIKEIKFNRTLTSEMNYLTIHIAKVEISLI